ncbi:MAG TPA: hypothetical protein VGO59_18995 [Verrucomicrobiae bacterium]|jgi:anti-sigma factor RsiW
MQNSEYDKLREDGWRRPLTVSEQARLREWLAAHPEAREPWREDDVLNGLLRRMPAAPVSSNFTARVLQEVRRLPEPVRRSRLPFFAWLSPRWMPRAALAAAMVCCGLISCREYEAMHRAQEAKAVANAMRLAALPSVDWLENFDTIDRLDKVKVADDELLTMLQ